MSPVQLPPQLADLLREVTLRAGSCCSTPGPRESSRPRTSACVELVRELALSRDGQAAAKPSYVTAAEQQRVGAHRLVDLELVALVAAVDLEAPAFVLEALASAGCLDDAVERDELGYHDSSHGSSCRRLASKTLSSSSVAHPLVTTVVGSYPQPGWLIDRERLGERLPPRVRARELWRVPEPFLEEAQDDATRLAVQDMERAGVDVITDGEMRRESYSNRFATALDGVDLDEPGVALDRTGHENPVPRVVGPVRRTRPVEVRDVEFLRSLTDRRIKITVPGPFTMTQQAQNDHYADDRSLALAYAEAVNEELRDLKAAGADVVQIDEPYLQARPEPAREYALEAINRALDGIDGETVLHTCFGYAHIVHDRPSGYPFLGELGDCAATQISLEAAQPELDPEVLRDLPGKTIVLGVLDLGASEVETPEVVADRIRRALAWSSRSGSSSRRTAA